MFGQNARFKKGFVDAPNLVVNSVFLTIQGEGPHAGTPAIFVRLSQCNLACTFCDTEFESGTKMTPQELMQKVREAAEPFGIPQKHLMLVVTGGEPLLQDPREFFEIYLRYYPDHIIQIETAGTVWQPTLDPLVASGKLHIVCSPKTPVVSTHMARVASAWKYIVKLGNVLPEDGLPMCNTQPGMEDVTQPVARPTNNAPVYVQFLLSCLQSCLQTCSLVTGFRCWIPFVSRLCLLSVLCTR